MNNNKIKKKLLEQDDIINNIIITNEENKGIGKEILKNLKEQNKKISKISDTLDETQNDSKRLDAKFVDMIFDSSFAELYIIIGILAPILLWLLL